MRTWLHVPEHLSARRGLLGCGGSSHSSAARTLQRIKVTPDPDTWTKVGRLAIPRTAFTATLLPSGKVIVAGGWLGSEAFSETELFDPNTGTWSPAARMETAREGHVATLLPNSTLLIAGGVGSPPVGASCELYW
jgi:hypothetical protein